MLCALAVLVQAAAAQDPAAEEDFDYDAAVGDIPIDVGDL
jgi:hypothetical protein